MNEQRLGVHLVLIQLPRTTNKVRHFWTDQFQATLHCAILTLLLVQCSDDRTFLVVKQGENMGSRDVAFAEFSRGTCI